MGRVIVEMSPSIDGYVAGNGISADEPFGDAGERLHRWIGFDGAEPTAADREAAARMFENTGAVVIGRRMFDVGIDRWGEDGAFGVPTFVVTGRGQDDLVRGRTTFRFVTGGIAEAVSLAKAAAGDRDVVVAGGANVVQQCFAAGYVDEVHLHVVPVVLGGGTPLFTEGTPRHELTTTSVVTTPYAIHLTLEVPAQLD